MTGALVTDVAVTAMSCRFPGARSVAEFRRMLIEGRTAFRTLTLDEVVAAGVPPSIAAECAYVRVAAPLEGIDEFDVDTFRLAPAEVAVVDPQHYHFLECTYEVLHLTGCLPHSQDMTIGVFGGADLSYFAMRRLGDEALWDPAGCWQELMGNDSHFMVTSVAYRLGLTGPGVGVQTACSTSLVAVHMAVQALIARDCDVAVAGGASIRGPQARGYLYREGGILSPTGRCRPFDDAADGTVLSSGVGAVALMRLSDALAGGFPIWAVIKATAVNNDGDRKVGYTAPSVTGQAAVIADALAVSGVDPATVAYVEAHGTGTRLGDPIEFRGLINGYAAAKYAAPLIRIGSVKSNFGHLESAAGVAGLIKAVLSVRLAEVYPSLGFGVLNSTIDAQGPFRVAERYERGGGQVPRRAAVSSFGIGGTNCHVVLEQAPPTSVSGDTATQVDLSSYTFHRKRVWAPPARPVSVPAASSCRVAPPTDGDAYAALEVAWREILGRAPSPGDDFLSSGGDSLKATRLSAAVREALGASLAVDEVLEARSFTALADTLAQSLPSAAGATGPLSAGQQSLWALQSSIPRSPAYSVQAVFSLTGLIEIAALRSAFNDLVSRQEALRTAFSLVGGEVCQRVIRDCAPVPWRHVTDVVDPSAGLALVAEHGRTLIDLGTPPLLSVLLVRTGPSEHLLSVVSHHIVSDEWSAEIMLGDALEFYMAGVQRRPVNLPALRTTMSEVARREADWLRSGGAESKLRYWKGKLSDTQRFDLPWTRRHGTPGANEGAVLPIRVPPQMRAELERLAHAHSATPFMVLATVFKTLWLRYTGLKDLCIGTNIAGRDELPWADVVGLFTRTVALRTDLSGNPTFSEALRRVRATALEAYANQLSFPLVVDTVHPPRLPGRNPLFDAMLVLQNVPRRMVSLPGLQVSRVPIHNGTCKFDLELTMVESADGGLEGRWEYSTALFDPGIIEQFSQHLLQLLESAVAAPDRRLSRLALIPPAERAALLDECSLTTVDLRVEGSGGGAWEVYLERTADRGSAPAVVSPDGSVTSHAELRRRAAALAANLRQSGLEPGQLVGILAARSAWYVEALLGVLACGAAFLPLDASLPDARLIDILRDAQVQHVVARERDRRRLTHSLEPGCGRQLDKLFADTPCAGSAMPGARSAVLPGLAYVIYTSGSTGRPKGAMVSQAGMLNHLLSKVQTLYMNAETRVAFTAPLCFDISIWQILSPLLAGGSVVVIHDGEVADLDALCRRVSEDRVSIVELVPSYLDALLGHLRARPLRLPELRFMVATGERLPVTTARLWFECFPAIPLVNAYGPTECSDDVLQYVLKAPPDADAVSVPVGYALPNTRVFILDPEGDPVPHGAVGEISVGGVCVGLGYLNDAERTEAAFVPDRFSQDPTARLYRTGDLARRRSDGAVEYLGRSDGQVKVRGARVEVEEIETVLRHCPGVGDVAVVPNGRGDALLAFLTPAQGAASVDVRGVRQMAQARMPGFMLPSSYIPVHAIPKTPSGKVDRAALARGVAQAPPEPTTAPEVGSPQPGPLAVLNEIWCRVLDRPFLAPEADFFESGGDSLRAIRIAALAQDAGLPVTAASLAAHPILQDLAATCRAGALPPPPDLRRPDASGAPAITPGERWFLEQEYPDAHLHDSGFILTLTAEIPASSVEKAVVSLWRKHESLRATFSRDRGSWRKEVLPVPSPAAFSVIDVSGHPPEVCAAIILAERNRIPSVDAPLFRATYFVQRGEPGRLLIIGHYMACDLVSWQVLLDAFIDELRQARPAHSQSDARPCRPTVFRTFDTPGAIATLSAESTCLLRAFVRRSGNSLDQMLAAAAAYAVSLTCDKSTVRLGLGRHGRGAPTAVDGRRAVGRFAFPVVSEVVVEKHESPEQLLTKVAGVLRGNARPLTAASGLQVDVFVDFLGDATAGAFWSDVVSHVEPTARRLGKGERDLPLEVVGSLQGGALSVRVDGDGTAAVVRRRFLDSIRCFLSTTA